MNANVVYHKCLFLTWIFKLSDLLHLKWQYWHENAQKIGFKVLTSHLLVEQRFCFFFTFWVVKTSIIIESRIENDTWRRKVERRVNIHAKKKLLYVLCICCLLKVSMRIGKMFSLEKLWWTLVKRGFFTKRNTWVGVWMPTSSDCLWKTNNNVSFYSKKSWGWFVHHMMQF